ncbi:SH3 domain-containing protein [Zhengella mangrovi]|nr:SH3 domain-containing protein [Zhengella mangrovi]
MIRRMVMTVAVAAFAGLAAAPASAGDCTGYVVGVRPISQYDHDRGNGFLAVRTGPGTRYRQIGELYAGDEVSVWNFENGWYEVACMAGDCTEPYWGRPSPRGWVSARYIDAQGVCP